MKKQESRPVVAGRWLETYEYRLFPLDGFGSAVPSFQLHPVFSIGAERVPPSDAKWRFVGFGDKSWDNFKTFLKFRALSFYFCPKGHGGTLLEAR